jgi:PncC family amidohydrolase
LLSGGKTLAVAESCTGGGIGSAITSVAGSSEYFLGGVIAYSDKIKERELGVPKSHITRHGAVSKETALSMARGVRRKFKSTYGLSVTGVAGPGGGTKEKPVGLTCIAASGPKGDVYKELRLGDDRKQNRERSVFEAIHLLFRFLTGKAEPENASDGWRVYLVECKDGSYYCGVTNDIKKRIAVHNSGKGALYTKWKRPVTLVAKSPSMSKSEALSLELKVKKLGKKELKKKMVKKG